MAKLRTVQLEEVARYLECDSRKLRIALKHLAETPSVIEYSKDAAVFINPAVRRSALTPEEAAKAAAGSALDLMAKEALDKIILNAADRLDQDGRKGNYSMVEVIAFLEAEKAAEKEARYQAVKPTLMLYCTMKPGDEKWLN